MLKVGILISGRGTNMKAIIDAALDPLFPARAVVVISNNVDAPALALARSTNTVPVEVINHRTFATREARMNANLTASLAITASNWSALQGFMRLLTPWFTKKWHDKLLNIHPSLLPDYPGLDTHKRADR